MNMEHEILMFSKLILGYWHFISISFLWAVHYDPIPFASRLTIPWTSTKQHCCACLGPKGWCCRENSRKCTINSSTFPSFHSLTWLVRIGKEWKSDLELQKRINYARSLQAGIIFSVERRLMSEDARLAPDESKMPAQPH